MRSLFYDPEMEPYYRAGRRLLEQHADNARRRQDERKHAARHKIETADRAVVAAFTSLQQIWRRQGTLPPHRLHRYALHTRRARTVETTQPLSDEARELGHQFQYH